MKHHNHHDHDPSVSPDRAEGHTDEVSKLRTHRPEPAPEPSHRMHQAVAGTHGAHSGHGRHIHETASDREPPVKPGYPEHPEEAHRPGHLSVPVT